MHGCLKSKDERVWLAVQTGWTVPTITSTVDNVVRTTIKPVDRWSKDEIELAKWNSKDLNAIQSHVTEDEFKKIATCETSKEALEILEVIYEGTNTVKNSKIQ